MKRLISLLLGALAMLGLAACDAVNMKDLKPGVSTGYDVRDKLGKPGIEWRNDDGSVTWEYTRQPEGTECFMATIGPDNILKSLDNVLTPELRPRPARLDPRPGAPPARQAALGAEVCDEEGGGVGLAPAPEFSAEVFFNIHFDEAGVVTGTSRSTQPRGS
jgi:hypothetical protein